MIITHPHCLLHDMGATHPESPQRLRVVMEALSHAEFDAIPKHEAIQASRVALERAHTSAHVARMLGYANLRTHEAIDSDVILGPHSIDAALHAAGAAVQAVDAVIRGESKWAFCAVRPPGHHATPERAMGFCIFNNIAVAAHHALAEHGLKRIAIVDFDVHHGNGTQDIFFNDPRVLFASTHQMPLYPGTGAPKERGAGNILNVALKPGANGVEFRHAFETHVLPAIESHRPELILISAGFDAHRMDPLASVNLEVEDFEYATRALGEIADRHCDGRIVSSLEGGYSLTALRACVAAHVRVLARASK